MSDRILILGASARAAAASARRAGFEPFAIDLFADADTERICDCLKCPADEYPHGLFHLARQAPPMPWMYTGGVENYPELVEELAAERELWGNGPEVLRQVRSPFGLSAMFADAGVPYAEPWSSDRPLPSDRRWLRKPLRGSAGHGIRFVTWTNPRSDPARSTYFQEFVPGQPLSAICVANGEQAFAIAFSTQLIGTPWLHAPAFRYAGNVLVYTFTHEQLEVARRSANVVGRIGIRGLFGIDFIQPEREPAHVIEVNPRYVASVELVEHRMEYSAWFHFGQRGYLGGLDAEDGAAGGVHTTGKAIYYAPHRLTFPASGPWDDSLACAADIWRRPDYADIPHAGDAIEPGHPVLTILAEAATEADCLSQLQSRAADLDRLFGVAL